MDREYILRFLQAKIKINEHIIGAAVGSGITAKYYSGRSRFFIGA
ncbi:hypothetical protein [Lonepinella koalarum]|nr:hypothetical protein [Lonepinella koalarum]